MDTNQPQNNPSPSLINPMAPEKKSTGPTIGLIIVVLVIILGGLYFWSKQTKENSDTNMMAEQEAMMIKEQGSSDEVGDIEADLNATNLDNLDAELGDIDAELQAQ